MMSNSNNYQNINVSNTITATNLNCNNLTSDNLVFNNLTLTDLTLTGKINNNVSPQNLNSLDTTTSITSQFIDAKNYTDNKINLLLNNPDVSINSIQELFNILGNDPNLNVVNSLASKISKTESNQTIDALNLNFTNPIIGSDFLLRNNDNSTKSIKNTIQTNETNITSLTNTKLDRTGGTGTDNQLISPLVRQHLYISNSGGVEISTTKYSTSQGVIAGNLSSGQKEINFVNTDSSLYGNTNNKAFCFHKFMTDGLTLDDFFTIFNNGRAVLKGDLTTNGISISSLNSSLGNLNNVLKVANGNLGIGTTGPIAPLHVVGNSILNGNTTITGSLNSGSVSTGSNITSGGNLVCLGLMYSNVLQCNSGSLLSLNRDITNAITHINGRMGINTTNPINALHIIGDATINGSSNTTGNINANSFTIGGLVNIGDALTNSMDLINSLQTQVNSLQSQINSLIKIKTRLRVSFSASSYVIITQSNVSSVARISSGVCGIILTQNSNVIGAWTPFVSVNGGTRSNVSSGASANYPDYDYVVSMSGDFGFSFMLIEQ